MGGISRDGDRHYLEVELLELLQSDGNIWHFLQSGSLDGVWYWNLDKPHEEWMSPEFWRLFGIDPATKAHSPDEWQEIIFEEDLKTALDNFTKHCADPNHPYDQIVRYRHVDGSTVWVRCRGVAIRDENGKAIRMLGAHNDLTEVKRAEAASRKISEDITRMQAEEAKELDRTNSRLRAFAYGLAHDLKSPAKNVSFLFDELRKELGDGISADQAELLSHINNNQARLLSMLNSVLGYATSMEKRATLEAVNCSQLLDEVLNDLEEDLDLSRGSVSYQDLPTITAERTQLKSLFYNLISNALKYARTDVPPDVKISSVAGSGVLYIDFQDNGVGIDPKDQDYVFEPFKRLHRHDVIEGAGLGLAICKQVADNHSASLAVRSNRAEPGTTFTLEWPMAQQWK